MTKELGWEVCGNQQFFLRPFLVDREGENVIEVHFRSVKAFQHCNDGRINF